MPPDSQQHFLKSQSCPCKSRKPCTHAVSCSSFEWHRHLLARRTHGASASTVLFQIDMCYLRVNAGIETPACPRPPPRALSEERHKIASHASGRTKDVKLIEPENH